MPKEKGSKKNKYYKGSFVIGKKADGTPERVYVRGRTKQERDEKLAEAKRLHARGVMLGDMTVREWSVRWMEIYKANTTRTQHDHYQAKLKYDILPVIGSLRMRDIRLSHLQALLNNYKGGKKGTVEKIRQAVRQLFTDAEVEGIIERNPATRLEMPEVGEEPRRPLTAVERQAVLKVAETHPRGPYVLTMLYCGLRRGETAALDRAAIDLENKRLTVNKSLTFDGNVGDLGGTKAAKMRKNTPRNGEEVGVRVVPIPDALLPILTEQCESKEPGAILFPKGDGKHATGQTLIWWWRSFSRACHITAGAKLYRNAVLYDTSPFGEEVTPHYLRHTYATDLYAAGVDEKARKEFLGHASKDVTETYTAMTDEAFDRASALLNEYYKGEKWKPKPSKEAAAAARDEELDGDLSKFETPEELFKKLGI
ncbi:MAG: site-specific integrase [Oscillospiraceae bacterium]|jgi:integrase|nr:site-specific integrase [Oscillospiraceae bacterium]